MRPMLQQEDFARMFRDHHSLVYRTAYRITGNDADAEDVLQTLFLRLLRRQFPPDLKTNPRGYLHRASVNIALDVIRLRKSTVPVEETTSVENTAIEANEIQRLVQNALAGLPPKLAEIFVLKYVEGYDNAEIADLLETSRNTIAVLLFRARSHLKRRLAGEVA